jgi:hypothetical protein
VIEGDETSGAAARFELTTSTRSPAHLLTKQARSSNCGLGRAFGREPNGSVRSLTARNQKRRLTQPLTTFSSARNPNTLLRCYDGASWHCRHGGNVLSPQQLPRATFASCAQALGREPNALPKLCNCYAYSTIKAPDKGEVGGSSPPRPTIQITSKYATIVTFPLFGDLPQKTVLPKICQKSIRLWRRVGSAFRPAARRSQW